MEFKLWSAVFPKLQAQVHVPYLVDWDNISHGVTSVTLNVTSVTTLKKDSTKGPK